MPWTPPAGAGATVQIWNGYSLAERDRRWNAVRANAIEAGFDCILIPLGNGADARYLTQLRCSAMALPADGRAPIVIADRSSTNEWVPAPWQTGREWAEPMAEALGDLGMERARIGVAGLRGGTVTHCAALDGVVNHTAFEFVRERFPHAQFADATDVVGLVRFVKSAEEIAWVRESARAAEAGLEALIQLARPGADAGALYADALARLLELRSEYFPLTLTLDSIDAPRPRRYANPPLGRRLGANALIAGEVNAIRGAQLTQVSQPIVLGRVPEAWQPVIDLHREVYEAGLALMKPGASFAALVDLAAGLGAQRGRKAIARLHGCGYGDDGPLVTEKNGGARACALTMAPGNAFVWKPLAMSADEKIRFSFGGPVLVTERGCENLFTRAHGMIAIA